MHVAKGPVRLAFEGVLYTEASRLKEPANSNIASIEAASLCHIEKFAPNSPPTCGIRLDLASEDAGISESSAVSAKEIC